LPGAATALNFDAHGSFRWIAGLMLLPILVPLVLRPVSRWLANGRTWAMFSVLASTLLTLWIVTSYRIVVFALLPHIVVVALCVLLRNRDMRFTRSDAVLLPAFLATWLGVMDVGHMTVNGALLLAAFIVFIVRLFVALVPSPLPPALSFVVAPLGLVLQTGFFARDERYFGWHALALVVVTPFLLRIFVRRRELALRKALLIVIYPLALYAYTNAMSLATAEGKPRVNLFEDGHSLLPVSEYLRGEAPYRDILPAHGLIEDGGFDWLAMKATGVTLGTRLKARLTIGGFSIMAFYTLAFFVTGSAEAALLAALLAILTGSVTAELRPLVTLGTLALLAAAVRMRRRWLWVASGVAVVFCCATSLDYGVITLVTLIVVAIRNRTWKDSLAGVTGAGAAFFLALTVFGVLGDFFRGTFLDTSAAATAYTLEIFTPPEAMRAFPDVLVSLLDRNVFYFLLWCAIAIFLGVARSRRPGRRPHEAIVAIAVWTVGSAVSYAERHHLRFAMLAAIVIVYVIVLLLRRRSVLAFPAIAAAISFAAPTTHLAVVGWMRGSRGPIEPGWAELTTLPRARGALLHERDIALVESMRKYLDVTLRPDETFFDFSNHGIVYFLLRRDCPIREYEVAFYETDDAQREVIRRLQSNPKIRAAFVPTAGRFMVDGIPNSVRAPLVWSYLQANFEPDFEEGEAVLWRRK
jgi:hypothetical protein